MDHIWSVLQERINDDLEQWHKLSGNTAKINVTKQDATLTISRATGEESSVRTILKRQHYDIRLKLARSSSQLGSETVEELHLRPFVNQKGQCCLMLNEQELEPWQASRLALEQILFL
jgi:hypothetical protein